MLFSIQLIRKEMLTIWLFLLLIILKKILGGIFDEDVLQNSSSGIFNWKKNP